MGRFKVYDPTDLVIVLSDSNYVKCLLCEKKLKNIMGNIKRHYEQMHSVHINTNVNKTKGTRKRPAKFRDDDKDFKISKSRRKPGPVNKKNAMTSKIMDKTKTTEIPTAVVPSATSTGSNKNLSFVPVSSIPENPMDYNQNHTMEMIQAYKQDHPINLATSPPLLQESELKENEKPDIYLKPHTLYSDEQRVKLNDEKVDIQIPCHSYINNIQIDSMDSYQPLEFLKCLVETKTHVNIPLKIFQKADTFQKALETWEPNFQFNYSSLAIGEHIDRMTKRLRREIIQLVTNRIIYLKLDVVSSTQGNLMFVNIQFLNDFKIQVITLSALKLSDDDLATKIKQKVLVVLERYKIDISRVDSIVKDVTSNFRNTPFKHNKNGALLNFCNESVDGSSFVPQSGDYSKHLCNNFPGHVIHFVATDIIKLLNENISQSRDTASSLRQEMSNLNIEQMPLLDNATSWISVYDMIESLLKIRDTVESNKQIMTEVDWIFVTKFVSSFKPIVDMALMLQTNDIFIMGDFYREWLLCEIKLDELRRTNEIASYLLEAFHKRKMALFQNTSFLCALYIDPRFCYKESKYLSDIQKETAIIKLLQIFNTLKAIEADKASLTSTNGTDIKLNDRYTKLEELAAASCKTNMDVMRSYDTVCWANVDENCVKQSLALLQFEERLSFTANILDYWSALKSKSPILAKIAETALGAPATQATINRVLNTSSLSLIRRKLNENTDNTENLLLLKLNQDLVNTITLEN